MSTRSQEHQRNNNWAYPHLILHPFTHDRDNSVSQYLRSKRLIFGQGQLASPNGELGYRG